MKFSHVAAATMLLGSLGLQAEVPELLELVPEAKGYELIAKFNPLRWRADGYQTDRSEQLSGDLKRIGYLVKLTAKNGETSWVFASMDAFTQVPALAGVPSPDSQSFQQYVTNLEVAGNVAGVKTGKFEKGNIEIWGLNYGGNNAKNIPGATGKFDFGDSIATNGAYGSFQVHNYLEKQTVFAFNNFNAGPNCDLGIGNNPNEKGNPDWTFSKAGSKYKTAEIYVVGKFDNLSLKEVVLLDPQKTSLTGSCGDKMLFAPGEEMVFTLKADFQGQKPTSDYFVKWSRTGDDGKKASGKAKVVDGEPIVIKTSLDKPGFVRIYATLVDRNGRNVMKRDPKRGNSSPVFFDGGAGVEIDKLQGVPEPEDFDAFWAKQKAKLDAVPVKAEMKKARTGKRADVYAVKVDCAGPRPVTGYLTIPINAKEKSLPAIVNYPGYGTRVQQAPGDGAGNAIVFTINAHGYDLGQDAAYYKKFFDGIRSNGKGYAFDKKQNSDPETAYFNGMALRVMRSLQFVKTLPQWNGKDLRANGGSQGGLQTIWAAALDPDVNNATPWIPWCCDLGGITKGRLAAGWRLEYTRALDYFDPINHAKRIKCPVFITRAGLGDYTCPPSGVAILYNNIKSPKKIVYVQGSTHGYVPPKAQKYVQEQK